MKIENMDRNQQEQFKLINTRIDGLNQRINESDQALSQKMDEDSRRGDAATGNPKSEKIQQFDVEEL